MLLDTYAIRFVQAGGGPITLREQLGIAGLASVKRYQDFCERRKEERKAQIHKFRASAACRPLRNRGKEM